MEYDILKTLDVLKRILEILTAKIFFSEHNYALKNIIAIPSYNHFIIFIKNLENNFLINKFNNNSFDIF